MYLSKLYPMQARMGIGWRVDQLFKSIILLTLDKFQSLIPFFSVIPSLKHRDYTMTSTEIIFEQILGTCY